MHVRCNYCRHSFNLGRDFLVGAVLEAQENRQKYHGLECPGCRKLIKVPLNQMKRFVSKEELEKAAAAAEEASEPAEVGEN